jgi:steroid delta-isomerase-like uncharacterized protein
MSVEKTKAVVRGYIEQVWNARRPDLIEQYMAADAANNDAPGLTDREAIRNFIVEFQKSFPDIRVNIEAMIGEGDLVVIRETLSGTQEGDYMGMPASGKSFTTNGVFVFRVADGKIAEFWGLANGMSMMQQLGAIPAPDAG